jgi:DNA-binding MarR family transcriptional regulator
MRDTSLTAYNQLKHLNDKQQSVLIFIHGHPDCTDKEIATGLAWTINRVTPRRGELETKGYITSTGVKLQDNRKAHTWKLKQ